MNKPIIAIAPMMDCTDRHYRYFMRLISKHTLLYTEMVTTGALLHGDRERYLRFDHSEHPVALQLGGNDPQALAQCAKMGADHDYDQIDLNVGCPSDRVKSGAFGACLMAQPALVADCVAAMIDAVDIPISVKTRIGIDDSEEYAFIFDFISQIYTAGCRHVNIHARKAWLQGLSPKQNRTVPPLRYDIVYRIKKDFPDMTVVINGGIKNWEQAEEHLQYVDGVMLGREAYSNPYCFAEVDKRFFDPQANIVSHSEIIKQWIPYLETQKEEGARLQAMLRHILGLYQAVPGARAWRRYLTEQVRSNPSATSLLNSAQEFVGQN